MKWFIVEKLTYSDFFTVVVVVLVEIGTKGHDVYNSDVSIYFLSKGTSESTLVVWVFMCNDDDGKVM